MPVMLTPSLVRRSFLHTIDAMENDLDNFVLNPGRDFTRHRLLPLKHMNTSSPISPEIAALCQILRRFTTFAGVLKPLSFTSSTTFASIPLTP